MVGYHLGLGRLRCYVQLEEFPTPVKRETPVAILREERETGRNTVESAQRASAGNVFCQLGLSLFEKGSSKEKQ